MSQDIVIYVKMQSYLQLTQMAQGKRTLYNVLALKDTRSSGAVVQSDLRSKACTRGFLARDPSRDPNRKLRIQKKQKLNCYNFQSGNKRSYTGENWGLSNQNCPSSPQMKLFQWPEREERHAQPDTKDLIVTLRSNVDHLKEKIAREEAQIQNIKRSKKYTDYREMQTQKTVCEEQITLLKVAIRELDPGFEMERDKKKKTVKDGVEETKSKLAAEIDQMERNLLKLKNSNGKCERTLKELQIENKSLNQQIEAKRKDLKSDSEESSNSSRGEIQEYERAEMAQKFVQNLHVSLDLAIQLQPSPSDPRDNSFSSSYSSTSSEFDVCEEVSRNYMDQLYEHLSKVVTPRPSDTKPNLAGLNTSQQDYPLPTIIVSQSALSIQEDLEDANPTLTPTPPQPLDSLKPPTSTPTPVTLSPPLLNQTPSFSALSNTFLNSLYFSALQQKFAQSPRTHLLLVLK